MLICIKCANVLPVHRRALQKLECKSINKLMLNITPTNHLIKKEREAVFIFTDKILFYFNIEFYFTSKRTIAYK